MTIHEMKEVLFVKTQDGWSSLMIAVTEGKTKVVSLLLKSGANIDLQHKVYTI